ncbi:MAG: LamG domain-containing protein [Leptolyngbyaceae cyanobacterium SM2_5_2]|nr:LamG domain-containing protein [Leptolyngbyaceae cyanobacterium SM2_5_2]
MGSPLALFEYKQPGSDTTGTPRQEDNRNSGGVNPGINAGQPQQPVDIGSSNQPLEFGSGFTLSALRPEGGRVDSINGVAIDSPSLSFRSRPDEQTVAFTRLVGIELANDRDLPTLEQVEQLIRLFREPMAIAPSTGCWPKFACGMCPWRRAASSPRFRAASGDYSPGGSLKRQRAPSPLMPRAATMPASRGRYSGLRILTPVGQPWCYITTGRSWPVPRCQRAIARPCSRPRPSSPWGGLRRNNQTQEFFQGEMEEVRVWKTARTVEQIHDNLFRRLLGENEQFLDNREDLLAYYPFDTQQAGVLSDFSLLGNDLIPFAADFVLSTAPIGEDTPQVRSALAGLRTPFNDRLQSVPAVQEYGDLQTDVDGNLFGVYKRCYGLIKDGQWELITGFKVGELVTEWVGQVQFDPQLIGYIEGSPPVPGENLTSTGVVLGEFADYNGASSVELKQASKTNFTFSAENGKRF